MGVYNKKKEDDDRNKWFQEREQKNKQIDRWYEAIELVIIGLTIVLCFYNWQFAIITAIWVISNVRVYEDGCDWLCIDEIDMPDSALGLRFMFKSWIILLPLLAIGAILIWVNCPIIALIYGIIAIGFIYPIAVEEHIFNF